MKKLSISFLLFIIIISICNVCNGYEEKFIDWVYDNNTVTVGQEKYRVLISDNIQNIRVFHDDLIFLVSKDDCTTKDKVKICVEDFVVDDFSQEKGVYMGIYYKIPDIEIIRTVNNHNVEIGDPVEFELSLENIGNYPAADLIYTDSFPKEITILSVSGECKIGNDNSIILEGKLETGQKLRCDYTIIPSREIEVDLKAQIDYFDGYENKTIYSTLINLKSDPIFEINTAFDNEDVQLGENFKLYFNITNIINQRLDFSELSFKFPDKMKVEFFNIEKSGDKYIWDGSISYNDTKEIVFEILPLESGNFEVLYDINLIKKDDKRKVEIHNNKIDFEIEYNNLEITSNLDDKNSFDTEKEVYITFFGENIHNYTDFVSIKASLENELFYTPLIKIDKIEKNSKKVLYKTRFLAPKVNKTTSYEIKLDINYTTEFGVKKSILKSWKINIYPESALKIVKKLSKSEIFEDTDVVVTVTVKNTRKIPLYDLKLTEILPNALKSYGKTNSMINLLEPDETQTAYIYTIHTPEVVNKTKYYLNTSITYFEVVDASRESHELAAKDFETLELDINPKKLTLNVKKTAKTSEIDLGELIKVTYIIENKYSETAYNIHFFYTTSENVDLLEKYDYFLDRLEPGEIIEFQKEVIKPKKVGRYNTGETFIKYNDIDNNQFNYSINSLSINVRNRTINGPLITLEKTFNYIKINDGEIYNTTIIAKNKGNEGTKLIIYDDNKKTEFLLRAGQEKNLTYKKIARQDYIEKDLYAYYNYQGKEYRVYSKSPKMTFEAAKIININNTGNSSITEDKLQDEDEHRGFLGFILSIINLFKFSS